MVTFTVMCCAWISKGVLKSIGFCVFLSLSVILGGCVSIPEQHIAQQAEAYGFVRKVVRGNRFSHIVYLNYVTSHSKVLHVYLEGDGLPWLYGQIVAADPTPRNPLMLRLMAWDEEPSVYLGRPCYHGLADETPCKPELWTHGRYSGTVLTSMAAALKRLLYDGSFESLALFGYSGGGTLAMLLAGRFPQTHTVVTLAGNLDPDAWTRLHGYAPLRTSLNPTRQAPLKPGIHQFHFAGGQDRNVPAEMIRTAVAHQHDARFKIIAQFDHRCCWEQLWPSVLKFIAGGAWPDYASIQRQK
jgi:hypothetical protein